MVLFSEVLKYYQDLEEKLIKAETLLKESGISTKGFREEVTRFTQEHLITAIDAVDLVFNKWNKEVNKPSALERLKEMVNNNQIKIDPVMDDRMKDLIEMADMPIRIGGPSKREPALYCGHKIDKEVQ